MEINAATYEPAAGVRIGSGMALERARPRHQLIRIREMKIPKVQPTSTADREQRLRLAGVGYSISNFVLNTFVLPECGCHEGFACRVGIVARYPGGVYGLVSGRHLQSDLR